MDTLSSISCFSKNPFHRCSPKPLLRRISPKLAFCRASANPVREVAEDEVLRMFLRDRVVNGDLISKASDMFWLREVIDLVDLDAAQLPHNPQQQQQEEVMEDQEVGGFLKLTTTNEWISGADSAPINKKAIAKAIQDDRDRRKKLNFLEYEALKRELMLLSVGIGVACSGYCLIALSVQAAVSYAVGVVFSAVACTFNSCAAMQTTYLKK
ncbi:uncharacterized protein LOC126653726 isoform X2 [Mercurialis annua]|uniref:uncharacterized protein LOC126653726 isoform X2 n=1 Tax=Mercurialis annua TaxID=3986 RepID=UPI00215F0628|nr:uncharacterized protein LOC126653726 isoform X2 [Mercurialis annua]